MRRWLLITAVLSASACKERPCDGRLTGERLIRKSVQWCMVEKGAEAAMKGDVARAVATFELVKDEPARHAAYEWLITLRPPGLDKAKALELCDKLPPNRAVVCRGTWDRDYLWAD